MGFDVSGHVRQVKEIVHAGRWSRYARTGMYYSMMACRWLAQRYVRIMSPPSQAIPPGITPDQQHTPVLIGMF